MSEQKRPDEFDPRVGLGEAAGRSNTDATGSGDEGSRRSEVDGLDDASLMALDLLPPQERGGLTRAALLQVGALRESAALLAQTVELVAPSAGLKDRLMARVAQYEAMKPLADVRRHEDTWAPYLPGVDVKLLFHDAETQRRTILLRMQPGAKLPRHRHHDDEQCLVVSGDIRWGELVYEQGDFVVVGRDTTHEELHTVHGNVLLLIAGKTEYLPA
jgi:anti-sigma factor ChrR (cupin superfamily)